MDRGARFSGDPGLFESKPFRAVLGQLGGKTDAIWLLGNGLGLGLTVVAAFIAPRDGLFFAYLAVLARLALYLWAGSRTPGGYFDRMLRIGIVAGVLEIFADYLLVHWLPSGRLVYLTRDAILLESPLYMPIAWACVIVEFGYLPLRIFGLLQRPRSAAAGASRTGTGAAAAIAASTGGLIAGVSIGMYEYLAFRAGWWKYEPAKAMIGPYCAVYIPVGEALMFLAVLPIFAGASRRAEPNRGDAILWGTLLASVIFVAYAVAWILVEGLLFG